MKNNQKTHHLRWRLLVPVLASIMLCTSCREDYYFDEQEPTWLGESIYDFLVEEGKYTYYVKLIDELGQTPVLSRTGSKTLFVVDDSTFNEFFRANEWGVTHYDSLSMQQKSQIFYSSMLNNVFFAEMLGDAPGPTPGMTVRRVSATDVGYDLKSAATYPYPSSYYWNDMPGNALLLRDNTPAPMVVFANSYLNFNTMKGSDYAFITNQPASYEYSKTDVFVNGVRIAESNMKCKNGVVHRLEKLVIPLSNMAEIISTNASTTEFSHLLNRFSAPYLSESATQKYGNGAPVYVKKYFAERGHSLGLDNYVWAKGTSNAPFMTTPTDSTVATGLKFDPGWNTFTSTNEKGMNEDMGAIFVPTDSVMEVYWNTGLGAFLRREYGTWDNVPDRVVVDLLNNHMKSSFTGAVPSKFEQIKNDAQIDMGVKQEDVVGTILGCNGVVYLTNTVYSPVSYRAVTAPTLVNDNMSVITWAMEEYGFLAYLHSMDSYYSFILPTDEAFERYLDPLSVAKGKPEYWSFKYNKTRDWIEADVTDSTGTIISTIQGSWSYDNNGKKTYSSDYYVIQDRLEDIIDQHIIVDSITEIVNGKYYYQTKGNGTIKVQPYQGDGYSLYGGYQLEVGVPVNVEKDDINEYLPRIDAAGKNTGGNGITYIVSDLTQTSLKSVYAAMEEQAADESSPFYKFFGLMADANVFYEDKDYVSYGYTVDIFNTYHYTIYVPSNEAVDSAINAGLPTLEQAQAYIDSLNRANPGNAFDEEAYLDSIRDILHDFVCYHIHDNSVYVGGGNVGTGTGEGRSFQTGAMDMATNAFRRVSVKATNSSLTVTDAAGQEHNVVVDPQLEGVSYNIMTRDYLFNSADLTTATQIETSSFAVVHTIDGDVPLLYSNAQLKNYKEQVERMKKTLDKSTNE